MRKHDTMALTNSASAAGRRRYAPAVGIGVLLWLALANPLQASERVGEYQLKAAFLFHVTQFIEWPAASFRSASEPFRICLVGGDPFGESIGALEARHYRERPIRIQRLPVDGDISLCQLAYFSGEPAPGFADVAHGRSALPILTVSSDDGFAVDGGMIRFLSSGERLRMEINVAVARDAQLKISAKLLEVAARVIEQRAEGNRS